jgi:carbamoylphosphate synthase large subunit
MKTTRQSFQMIAHCLFTSIDSNEKSREIRMQVIAMAKKLGVIGLMNTQLAYQDDEIYIIEVNPRASRTNNINIYFNRVVKE